MIPMERIAEVLVRTKRKYIEMNDVQERQVNDVRIRNACIYYMVSLTLPLSQTIPYFNEHDPYLQDKRKECGDIYDCFDDYRHGTNAHNRWRNKVYSLYDYYELSPVDRKHAVNFIIERIYQQTAPSDLFDTEELAKWEANEDATVFEDCEDEDEDEGEGEGDDDDITIISTGTPPRNETITRADNIPSGELHISPDETESFVQEQLEEPRPSIERNPSRFYMIRYPTPPGTPLGTPPNSSY